MMALRSQKAQDIGLTVQAAVKTEKHFLEIHKDSSFYITSDKYKYHCCCLNDNTDSSLSRIILITF